MAAEARPRVEIEQRRTERVPIVIRVDYSTVDSFFSQFTENINEGGLFIETEDACPVDTSVYLQFKLPGLDEPIRTYGRVVWIRDGESPGMGIEFEDLDSAARARINKIVRNLRNASSGGSAS